jgi:Leucine-rich repeat (LRR) protein
MKITKTKLKQIIKEEIEQGVRARSNISLSRDQAQNIRQTQNRAQKIIRFLTSPDPDDVEQGLTILDTLEDQQLIDTIASHFVFRSDGRITIRSFKIPETTLGMLLSYFAEKSARVKNMMKQIETLDLSLDNFITNVDFLRFCTNLTDLNLDECRSLQNVDGLQGLTNLTRLNLFYCRSLQNVDGLQGLTNLRYLNLGDCTSLENVDGLVGCTNLATLILSGCSSLKNVDGLAGCTNLNWLNLEACDLLKNVDGLVGCTNLTSLGLGVCDSLENVDGLKGCTNLTEIDLSFCKSLENVDGLVGCTSLTYLYLIGCESLPPELQELFTSNNRGTAYEKFMEALSESKRNSL